MIIFINGSINAGKSTIAKLLAKELQNCAIVEIDTVRAMIDWMLIDQSIPLNFENAVSLIKNFAKRGLSVIVPYPLSQKNHDFMVASLKDINAEMYFFTLAPSIEKAQSDTERRKLTDWERERIKHHYEIGIPRPDFGEVIDTTNQTPEETTKFILEVLRRTR